MLHGPDSNTAHVARNLSLPATSQHRHAAFTFHIRTESKPCLFWSGSTNRNCVYLTNLGPTAPSAETAGMCPEPRREHGLMSYKSIQYYWVSTAEMNAFYDWTLTKRYPIHAKVECKINEIENASNIVAIRPHCACFRYSKIKFTLRPDAPDLLHTKLKMNSPREKLRI